MEEYDDYEVISSENTCEGNLWKGICWALFITGLAIGIVTLLIKLI